MLHFEWDDEKARRNCKKHRVRFEEASSVFADPKARLMEDPDHSDDEDRFVLLGMSHKLSLLVVCHCYRESEEVIRIISARKAGRMERNIYKEFLK